MKEVYFQLPLFFCLSRLQWSRKRNEVWQTHSICDERPYRWLYWKKFPGLVFKEEEVMVLDTKQRNPKLHSL